jgi:hypothetical protein
LMYTSSFVFTWFYIPVLDILLVISDTFLCSMPTLQVKANLLLDARQLLIFFVGILTYLESNPLLLIILCRGAISKSNLLYDGRFTAH